MPRQPKAPNLVGRVFARVDKFHTECPRCGEIIMAQFSGRAHAQQQIATLARQGSLAQRAQARAYNPITSVLRCPYCHAVYMVGLLIWPVRLGRQEPRVPADQRPTKAQALRLRQYAKGFVAAQQIARGDAVNVYVTAECTCPVAEGGWTPSCPVHGWETVQRAIDEQGGGTEAGTEDEDEDDGKR